MLERPCIVYHGFQDLKTIFFSVVLYTFFYKTEMYLPESPFFKNPLAGASGLVLMSVPVTHIKGNSMHEYVKGLLTVILLTITEGFLTMA